MTSFPVHRLLASKGPGGVVNRRGGGQISIGGRGRSGVRLIVIGGIWEYGRTNGFRK